MAGVSICIKFPFIKQNQPTHRWNKHLNNQWHNQQSHNIDDLIKGLMAGPAVSLYGSPTVSPVTAALCASEPLPP
jgi:hypothetical protein